MFRPFIKGLIGLIFLAPFQRGCYHTLQLGRIHLVQNVSPIKEGVLSTVAHPGGH